MAGSPYVIIKREDLCSGGIIAQHYFLHENMIRCSLPNNEVTLYYVHNKILLDFHVKGEEKLDHTSIKLLLEPPHLLTLPVVPTSLRYRGSITLENLVLTNYYCYSVLDIEWEAFHLYIHHDPIILPERGYIYGFQPNLLTDFEAPGPYRIQFMANYLDLCTPISPANMHDHTIPKTLDSKTCSCTPIDQTFYHKGGICHG